MKQSLQLRTSQHLALTPQLQQSIRLLQLSTLELQQELELIMLNNPLLERLDDPLDRTLRLLADGAINQSGPATESSSDKAERESQPDSIDGTSGAEDNQSSDSINSEWSFDDSSRSSKSSDDEDSRPQLEAHHETLREHLQE